MKLSVKSRALHSAFSSKFILGNEIFLEVQPRGFRTFFIVYSSQIVKIIDSNALKSEPTDDLCSRNSNQEIRQLFLFSISNQRNTGVVFE